MDKKSNFRKIFSFILVAIIAILYLLSVIFALLGNFELTLFIFAFNTVFVVIVYFILHFTKVVKDDAEMEIDSEEKEDIHQ